MEPRSMMTQCSFYRGKVERSKVDVDFRWGRETNRGRVISDRAEERGGEP